MNYEISWLLKGRIVLHETFALPTQEDVTQMDSEFLQYLAQAEAPLLHFIFDLSAQDKVPDLKTMANMEFTKHPALGWTLVAGKVNPLTKFLLTTVSQINKARFRLFSTRAEALDFLQEVDNTLPILEREG